MIVSLIIIGALVLVGALTYLHYRLTDDDAGPAEAAEEAAVVADDADSQCCGMHITCEKDSLLAAVSSDIVYYDDEELDTYRGRNPEQYEESEVEQFRDVLLTLLPSDIAGWARSLQLRGIELPTEVRDELLLIVSEARKKENKEEK